MKVKHLYFGTLLVLLFSGSLALTSCNADGVVANAPIAVARPIMVDPANEANAYDYVGRIHNELLERYLDASFQQASIPVLLQRLDSLGQLHPEFKLLCGSDYVGPSATAVTEISAATITAATSVVNATPLSIYGRSTLSNFISFVLDFSAVGAEYEEVHSFLVSYESTLVSNTRLTAQDREVLLSLSSVARYSLYAKKKPKKNRWDPDWDLLVGNIFGSIAGSGDGKAHSIALALAVGIVQNE